MSVLVTWNPSTEPDIASYRVERSTTGAFGSYSELVVIPHNLSGANYDSDIGKFFYQDETGLISYWYRLIAIDEGDNESSPSTPFQAISTPAPDSEVVGVEIFVKTTDPSPANIEGVNIGIFDPTTFQVMAMGVTDEDGRAAFLLMGSADPGATYEVRAYKLGVIFRNPFRIDVLAPLAEGEVNQFDLTGTPSTLPVSSDPKCCRCTGLFVNFANRPVAGVSVRISQLVDEPTPKVVGGNTVAVQVMTFQTNANGYLSIDLLRTGRYLVMIGSDEETAIEILVPDRPSVNLTDLLYPFPISLSWDEEASEDNAPSLEVGETREIPFEILFTNGETKTTQLGRYVDILIGDPDIVDASISDGKLVLVGKAAGSTTATPERRELKPERNPLPTFDGPALSITVTA